MIDEKGVAAKNMQPLNPHVFRNKSGIFL